MLSSHEHEIVQWAERLLTQPVAVIDTETTGTGAQDEAFQIAGYLIDGGQIGKKFTFICKPKRTIHPDAAKVHGYTNKDLDDLPDFAAHAQALNDLLVGRICVAYNAGFDRRLLWQTHQLRQLPFVTRRWECAMLAYADFSGQYDDFRGGNKWVKLVEACRRHAITIESAHDAGHDALACAELIIKLAALH